MCGVNVSRPLQNTEVYTLTPSTCGGKHPIYDVMLHISPFRSFRPPVVPFLVTVSSPFPPSRLHVFLSIEVLGGGGVHHKRCDSIWTPANRLHVCIKKKNIVSLPKLSSRRRSVENGFFSNTSFVLSVVASDNVIKQTTCFAPDFFFIQHVLHAHHECRCRVLLGHSKRGEGEQGAAGGGSATSGLLPLPLRHRGAD